MDKFTDYLDDNYSFDNINENQRKYDIKKSYDKFNKMLFDNSLPTNFPLKFSRTKKYGGAVKTQYYYRGKGRYKRVTSWEIVELLLSTFFLRTKEQLDGILVHEMIHVWLTVNEMHEGYNVKYHGPEFVQKRNELQSKVDFEIPLVDTPDNLEIMDKKELKTMGVVIITTPDKESNISVFTEKVFDDKYEKLKDMMNTHYPVGSTIILGKSSHPTLEQFTIKRSISRISMYHISDKNVSDILETFDMKDKFVKQDALKNAEPRLDDLYDLMRQLALATGKEKEELLQKIKDY